MKQEYVAPEMKIISLIMSETYCHGLLSSIDVIGGQDEVDAF